MKKSSASSAHRHSLPDPTAAVGKTFRPWATLAEFLPYVWQFRARVLIALACLIAAKVANVGVPYVMKYLVDYFTLARPALTVVAVPVALLAAYGLLRASVSLFTELREWVFARVSQRVARMIVLRTFAHLLGLGLSFHLSRQTGAVSRDMERGSKAVASLMSFALYSILPTLVEVALVIGILLVKFSWDFALIAIAALVSYIVFTIRITNWRTHFRRQMNEQDSRANTHAIDALLNYETVKYFGNEQFEQERYDQSLRKYENAAVRSQTSLSLLNIGQALIIAVAVSLMMWRASVGLIDGRMSVGDLVLVNAFMVQLYVPLNFLGVIYRELRQNLIDLEQMFALLREQGDVKDQPDSPPLALSQGSIRFEQVTFRYGERAVLSDVSFEVPAGKTVAIVGPSGAGKSTISRLLFRFYDPHQGRILIDGQDIARVTQQSLRAHIGIVPQDTVLFNDSIAYNIAYGRPNCATEEIVQAAKAAHIHDFIQAAQQGYETPVGERGLKLSGGEKQRVAIARALLKSPEILVFDEATSALDSANEQAIQANLDELGQFKTVLIIAHRLSTVARAHEILVLEQGRIVERGTHLQLLEKNGRYANMWALQQAERSGDGTATA